MQIEGQFEVAAPPQALMVHLLDASLMASCLPGCETLERLADDQYRAVVVIAMAGIKAQFDLRVEITRRDEHNIWSLTKGEEGGRASSLQSESVVTLTPVGTATLVSYKSEVNITGRLGRFALGMMKKKAQSMGDEFAENLRARLEALQADAATAAVEPAAAPAQAPVQAPAPRTVEASLPWWRRLWLALTGASARSS
ncbi:CoxG family protein [Hydrogenophaga sp. OTU3427]|uniref:CoxG family protein n=1 Tax=Hydrogenophaga sp. OTU3427 TaxID=3043856 RepID=UPI00313E8C59